MFFLNEQMEGWRPVFFFLTVPKSEIWGHDNISKYFSDFFQNSTMDILPKKTLTLNRHLSPSLPESVHGLSW